MKLYGRHTRLKTTRLFGIHGLIICLMVSALFLFIGCGKPKLQKPFSGPVLPAFQTEGYSPARLNYLDQDLKIPLQISKQVSLNGLPVRALFPFGSQMLFTTHHGYLYSIHIPQLNNDHKTRIAKGISAAPALAGTRMFIPAEKDDAGLIAYDLESGSVIWEKEGLFSMSNPVTFQDYIIHSTKNGSVHCFKQSDGTLVWKQTLKEQIRQNMARKSDSLLVITRNGHLYHFSATDGSIRWSQPLNKAVTTQPLLKDGRIYLATYDGMLLVVDQMSGHFLEQKTLGINIYQSLSADETSIYVPCSDGVVLALNASDYTIKWRTQLQGPFTVPLLVTPQWIIAGTSQRNLYILNKKSGQIEQSIEMEGRLSVIPLIVNQRLIIALEYDTLAVLEFNNAADKKAISNIR